MFLRFDLIIQKVGVRENDSSLAVICKKKKCHTIKSADLLIAHSSIGLAGGSYIGSVVAKVGLAPELLRAESLATLAETLLALLLL